MEPSIIPIDKGRWQYESDPAQKPLWKFYSLEENYLIEKAYYDQQKEVDIGDRIISLNHLIQKQKGTAVISQRSIRRVNWEEEDRSFRHYETELPKKVNNVFESLGNFVDFLSKRRPAMLDLKDQFEKIEESNDLESLHQVIIPVVICCLEGKLMSLFQKEFGSFEEFYGEILRAFTMNSGLYDNLNGCLRSENWDELDKILPYVFCLFRAFFKLNVKGNWNSTEDTPEKTKIEADEVKVEAKVEEDEVKIEAGEIKMEGESEKLKSIKLYRGTAFDEYSLSFFKNSRDFCWNGVTSASTDPEVAERFMYANVDLKNKKYPVLFIIEVPENSMEWMDIHEYSVKPEEKEVILAPGSEFELVECSTDKENRTVIKLKMMKKVSRLNGKSQVQLEKAVKLFYLEGKELLDIIISLSGNESIEEIEFDLCKFNKKSLRALTEVLPTLVRAKRLKFTSCVYPNNQEETSEELEKGSEMPCGIEKIEGLETNYFDEILNLGAEEDISNWASLRELSLNFRSGTDVGKMLKKIVLRVREDFSLTLNDFVKESGVRSFASTLGKFTQLTSLAIDFRTFWEITDEAVKNLASHGLKNLSNLTSLSLNFSGCAKLTNEAISSIACYGLKNLTQLGFLVLDFNGCTMLEGVAAKNLASQGLKNLTKLTSLSLCFSNCGKMKTPGFTSLARKGLENLTLDFSNCDLLTDRVISCLGCLGHLDKIKNLVLKFKDCKKITEEELSRIETKILLSLKQLRLRSNCDKILDFKSKVDHQENPQAQQPYTLFLPEEKNLVFRKSQRNSQVQKTSVLAEFFQSSSTQLPLKESLVDERPRTKVGDYLICLATDTEKPPIVLDQRENHLKISPSAKLTLDFFPYRDKITDKGLMRLGLEGLKSIGCLTSLKSLSLDFRGCEKISDEGVGALALWSLKPYETLILSHDNVPIL